MLRNSTHEIFAEKLYQKFKGNPHFSRPKFSRSDFTIHHYAGNVSSIFILSALLSFEKNKFSHYVDGLPRPMPGAILQTCDSDTFGCMYYIIFICYNPYN
jgi:hypothetical protein